MPSPQVKGSRKIWKGLLFSDGERLFALKMTYWVGTGANDKVPYRHRLNIQEHYSKKGSRRLCVFYFH